MLLKLKRTLHVKNMRAGKLLSCCCAFDLNHSKYKDSKGFLIGIINSEIFFVQGAREL